MPRLVATAIVTALLVLGQPTAARASDCPPVNDGTDAIDASCYDAEVPTVDANGDPIPFVEEIVAPLDAPALVPDSLP